MGPMPANDMPAEVTHKPFEQSCVFTFFAYEQSQSLVISRVIRHLGACLCDKKFSLARFAELKMGERTSQNTLCSRMKGTRHAPLWLQPIELVVLIIMQPLQ